MPVISGSWFLPLYLEKDVFNNDVGFVVRYRTGLGGGYIGCVTDYIDIVPLSVLTNPIGSPRPLSEITFAPECSGMEIRRS